MREGDKKKCSQHNTINICGKYLLFSCSYINSSTADNLLVYCLGLKIFLGNIFFLFASSCSFCITFALSSCICWLLSACAIRFKWKLVRQITCSKYPFIFHAATGIQYIKSKGRAVKVLTDRYTFGFCASIRHLTWAELRNINFRNEERKFAF